MRICEFIANELAIHPHQVQAVIDLLNDGATIPFIARYRKEATGNLDDQQLRDFQERLTYWQTLEMRKQTILRSIRSQGKLSAELAQTIEKTTDKAMLEDIYLPFKPKRRTKAQIAREAGLAPLAQALLLAQKSSPKQSPKQLASSYLNPKHNVASIDKALAGAQQILSEQFAEQPELINKLRTKLWREAELTSQVVANKAEAGDKFRDYFAYIEKLHKIPSHRALAIFRAQQAGVIRVNLNIPEHKQNGLLNEYEDAIAKNFQIHDQQHALSTWLLETIRLAWRRKIFPILSRDLLNLLKENADRDAIEVFSRNLKDLLLAPPAGRKMTLGLDPGIRTGVKLALIDDTGKVICTDTIYPFAPYHDHQSALATLTTLLTQYPVKLIAIGNGTASRETSALIDECLKMRTDIKAIKVLVSEAGASVYSASALASQELSPLDVSLRGAVSIARRLQDPLAELVKIDPKSIGIGQYQHDVNQTQLSQSLGAVVEDCVNAVGVDLNTASPALLTYVAGLNANLANNIVAYRDQYGAFGNRQALLKVPRLGVKTFEQAAGFLRIYGGDEPLDTSAVHPEAYPVVTKILHHTQLTLPALIGNQSVLKSLNPQDFVTEKFGLPTVGDILTELEKPGRDPRGTFKTAKFDKAVHSIDDVIEGMVLEGVVSNVTHFGAFVDIGIHQDGLVHISQMADHFVNNPREIVKAGDVIKVRVLDVDVKRKRLSLSMKKLS